MTDEETKCACGLVMLPPRLGAQGKLCPNCDTLSPEEEAGKLRPVSAADRRYTAAWRELMERIFPKSANRLTPIEQSGPNSGEGV